MIIQTPIIIISGPTASGKTQLAVDLAKYFSSSIINADSVQLYKDINILSAQPSLKQKSQISHLLYEYFEPIEEVNLDIWARKVADLVKLESNPIFLVGGTGLYLKAITEGFCEIEKISDPIKKEVRELFKKIGKENFYHKLINIDPKIINKISYTDSQRAMRAFEVFLQTGQSIIDLQAKPRKKYFDSKILYIFITQERNIIYNNCDKRFDNMIEMGAIREAENLYRKIGGQSLNVTKAHGYKELVEFLLNKITLDEAIKLSKISTRQYAKRQITWFNNQVKNGNLIQYTNFAKLTDQVTNLISDFLKDKEV